MEQEVKTNTQKGASRSSLGRWFIGLCSLTLFCAAIVMVLLAVAHVRLEAKPISLPFLQDRLVQELQSTYPNYSFSMRDIQLQKDSETQELRIDFSDLEIKKFSGDIGLNIPNASTILNFSNLLRGQLTPTRLEIIGGDVVIERAFDGSIALGLGENQENLFQFESIDAAFQSWAASKTLGGLELVRLVDAQVLFIDRSTGKSFRLQDSSLSFARLADHFVVRSNLELARFGQPDATVLFTLLHELGRKKSSLQAEFTNLSAADAADQVPGMNWLSGLVAPISGSLVAELAPDVPIGDFEGQILIGQGAIAMTDEASDFSVNEAILAVSFDSLDRILSIESFGLQSDYGNIWGQAEITLLGTNANEITAFFADIALDDVELNGEALGLQENLDLRDGIVRAKVDLENTLIDVLELSVLDEHTQYLMGGKSWVSNGLWQSNYNFRLDVIDNENLLKVWPEKLVPKTRKWLAENIKQARIADFKGNFQLNGRKPRFTFRFAAHDVTSRFMRSMPLLENSSGRGLLTDTSFELTLDKGHIIAPNGEQIDLDGTSLVIPDIKPRPAIGEVMLSTQSSLGAALHLIDLDPFNFVSKANISPSLAQGRLESSAFFRFPMSRKTKPEQVEFNYDAIIQDVTSQTLLDDLSLSASRLNVTANQKGISVSGPILIDELGADVTWNMSFAEGLRNQSTLNAKAKISQNALQSLGVILPEGLLSGETVAELDVDLVKGETGRFEMTSDLTGLGMQIDSVDWRKSRDASARFVLSGGVGDRITIDQLYLEAAGLTANGKVLLDPQGQVQELFLDRFKLRSHLDASVSLIPRENGTVGLNVRGGTADMRRFSQKGSQGGAVDASINLDRLTITNGIALTNLTAELADKGSGFQGEFTARVNGGERISGRLEPTKYGPKIIVRSADASKILRDTGLFQSLRGGKLNLELTPRKQDGVYDGFVFVETARLRNNSAVTDLLNAASLVGLLQQAGGSGIHFDKIRSQFVLHPEGVDVTWMNAIGASIGLNLNGVYLSKTKQMNFEGVITPFFLVNGSFERVFGELAGNERGEGLVGITYRIGGTPDNPKVRANPLSALAPGFLRNLFRKKIPKTLE